MGTGSKPGLQVGTIAGTVHLLPGLHFFLSFFIGALLTYILLEYIKIGAYVHTTFFFPYPIPLPLPLPSLLPMFDLVIDINLLVNVCHIL